MVTGVNHAQINVPTDGLDKAREFYVGLLGMKPKHRPTVFKSDGIWLDAGGFELHIGVEEGVERSKTRAHIAFEVSDLKKLRTEVESRGWKISEQPKIPNYERFHFRDPFGNNLEVMQREGTTDERR